MCTATNSAIQAAQVREEKQTLLTKPRRVGSGGHAGREQSRAPHAGRRRALRPFSAVPKPNFARKFSLESSILSFSAVVPQKRRRAVRAGAAAQVRVHCGGLGGFLCGCPPGCVKL